VASERDALRLILCGSEFVLYGAAGLQLLIGCRKMMTKEELQGSWEKIVGSVQEKYSQVTGDELQAVKGNFNQLIGLLHRKTGQTREEVEQFLESATGAASGTFNRLAETASDYAANAQQSMRQGYDRLLDSSHEGYESARRAVRQSPAESLAVAFGVGIVAGLFVGASLFGRRS
jgi:uncharacterized protein YjbJ (UPF0337 family)